MLAEPLALRPLGVEPVEDVFQLGLGDARALVLDGDLDRLRRPRARAARCARSAG